MSGTVFAKSRNLLNHSCSRQMLREGKLSLLKWLNLGFFNIFNQKLSMYLYTLGQANRHLELWRSMCWCNTGSCYNIKVEGYVVGCSKAPEGGQYPLTLINRDWKLFISFSLNYNSQTLSNSLLSPDLDGYFGVPGNCIKQPYHQKDGTLVIPANQIKCGFYKKSLRKDATLTS